MLIGSPPICSYCAWRAPLNQRKVVHDGCEAVIEDMLTDRELDRAALSHTTRKGTLPYLSALEILRLDSAMTNSEVRPHLVSEFCVYHL